MPKSQGGRTHHSQNFWNAPYVCQNSVTSSDKIWNNNTCKATVSFCGDSRAPIPRVWAPASPTFLGTSLPIPKWFDLKDPIWYGSMWCRSVFLGVSHAPIHSEWVPSITINFWTSYMRMHSIRNNNQILYSDQTTCEQTFYTFDYECQHMLCLR